jgi:hypothetical protein
MKDNGIPGKTALGVTRAFCNLPAFSKLQTTQTSGRFSFFAYDLEREKRSNILPQEKKTVFRFVS